MKLCTHHPRFDPRLFKIHWLVLMLCLAGCHSSKEDAVAVHNNYRFDETVISKLPVYDSLAKNITANFQLFLPGIDEKANYKAFRYMPYSEDFDAVRKLPPEVELRIDQYFVTLGKNFIAGFAIFKDSSIKIYIRNTPPGKTGYFIEESLSYYPTGRNIRRREYPDRDSLLGTHWVYWAHFENESFF